MIEFMDEIVEIVEQFVEWTVAGVLIIWRILAKSVIVLTTPVWILPYKVIKEMQKLLAASG